MGDILLSEFLNLNDELEENGVFDAVITSDSYFFINLLRLKQTTVPEFQNSYDKINQYFANIMLLLCNSKTKEDRFYKEALKLFSFSGVKGINLGFSSTGIDAGFGDVLSKQVISDAFDIVKTGSNQPEIFHLIGLFEDKVGPDRLSDMIATLVLEDIVQYTVNVNRKLNINSSAYKHIAFDEQGIAINPFKKCQLLYLPTDILHELPIAHCWEEVGRVAAENEAIRREINDEIGDNWRKIATSDRKYLIKQVLKNPEKCKRVIDSYKKESIESYDLNNNFDYSLINAFKVMKKSGVFDYLEHSDYGLITSFEGAMKVLDLFKEFVEDNKGWEIIKEAPSRKKEKFVQRLMHLAGLYFCETNNLDMSFEANEGPGSVDLKISRGTDKTVIEVKLASNKDCFHGYDVQIEEYAKAEKTKKKIFVYVEDEEQPTRLERISACQANKAAEGLNPPTIFVVDAKEKASASNILKT